MVNKLKSAPGANKLPARAVWAALPWVMSLSAQVRRGWSRLSGASIKRTSSSCAIWLKGLRHGERRKQLATAYAGV